MISDLGHGRIERSRNGLGKEQGGNGSEKLQVTEEYDPNLFIYFRLLNKGTSGPPKSSRLHS